MFSQFVCLLPAEPSHALLSQVAAYQGHHNSIPKLTVAWRKNSRAQMMAKQRVAVGDEADCASRPAPRRSTIVDIAAPIKGLAPHHRK
jgi:hypothetical protein